MTRGKIALVHPTANQNVREAALAFAEDGLLAGFWTGINWRNDGALDRLLGPFHRVREELRRRSFEAPVNRFVRTAGWREWGRHVAGHLGLSFLTREESGSFSTDAVYHSIGRHVATQLRHRFGDVQAVYAYDAGALEVFRAAKSRGIKCIYDHPIVYWRKVRDIQREEAELQPEWRSTLLTLRDSESKLDRKDEELALADVVVVASTFARESLSDAPGLTAPVRVVPYGAPSSLSSKVPGSTVDRLRVLFVGALTQAKGLGYLLQAVQKLGETATLTLIGQRVSADMPSSKTLEAHRWIPSLPHRALLEEIRRHDVLVLPSLHEGFGLVILEAMGSGTPVITTRHTGGADVIEDGRDGFLVPIRSADAIAEKLAILHKDRNLLQALSEAALQKARECSWTLYRQRLIALAREVMAN